MTVKVSYRGQARAAAGCASEAVELPSGSATLHGLLSEIARRHGARMAAMVEPKGHGVPSILVFVGEKQVAWNAPPVLNDGDEIMLLSPIAGG